MGTSEARVEWLTVAGDPDAWRSIGLTVTDDGWIPLMGTLLRVVPPVGDSPPGLISWAWSGIEPTNLISGLTTEVVEPPAPLYAEHELGALGLDHVVVFTFDLEMSSTGITRATGCEQRRVRDLGTIRQGFHRAGRGGLIIEVVQHPDADKFETSLWGVVLNVEDLDAAYDTLGDDRMSAPKDAVQPGRRIATIKQDVGLGTSVALMTPEPG